MKIVKFALIVGLLGQFYSANAATAVIKNASISGLVDQLIIYNMPGKVVESYIKICGLNTSGLSSLDVVHTVRLALEKRLTVDLIISNYGETGSCVSQALLNLK